MLVLVIVLVLRTVVNGISEFGVIEKRIIGGKPVVNLRNFKYQISLQRRRRHVCGGSIINTKYVLTAAHCMDPYIRDNLLRSLESISSIKLYGTSVLLDSNLDYINLPKGGLTIRAGSVYNDYGGFVVDVKAAFIHPGYNPNLRDPEYDVSLLELEEPLEFGETVGPIDIANPLNVIPSGTLANISGWGTVLQTGKLHKRPEVLQTAEIQVVEQDLCKSFYSTFGATVTDNHICAGRDQRKACQGDSGGPLVVDGVLIGVVSWGTAYCAAGPSVFTRISSVSDFVADVIVRSLK